jgi:hypothetical protein
LCRRHAQRGDLDEAAALLVLLVLRIQAPRVSTDDCDDTCKQARISPHA